jgi:hypothetical protein
MNIEKTSYCSKADTTNYTVHSFIIFTLSRPELSFFSLFPSLFLLVPLFPYSWYQLLIFPSFLPFSSFPLLFSFSFLTLLPLLPFPNLPLLPLFPSSSSHLTILFPHPPSYYVPSTLTPLSSLKASSCS